MRTLTLWKRSLTVPPLPWGVAIASIVVLSACGGGEPGGGRDASFPDEPLMVATGALDHARVTVWSDPQPLERGPNTLRLKLEDLSGTPLANLDVKVEPWMPAMGHGGPSLPEVIERGEGLYDVPNVALPMPGSWELRIILSGGVDDHFVLDVEVP
ncbi:MAG: FixH family protein [Myxococcaceae bacterium]|nr:FixH family protein [Myxococcaceae bacterium]